MDPEWEKKINDPNWDPTKDPLPDWNPPDWDPAWGEEPDWNADPPGWDPDDEPGWDPEDDPGKKMRQ